MDLFIERSADYPRGVGKEAILLEEVDSRRERLTNWGRPGCPNMHYVSTDFGRRDII